ncbi:Aldehyde/histidinol dehydrogenase [Xylogone sp. PMI_703]|nr:Aldehyde/histidinol dehydrogenase [Xylogone sp. PMI_703]
MGFITSNNKQIVPVWINGEAQEIHDDRLIEVVSAEKGGVVHYAQGASPETASAAADAALVAFQSWKHSNYADRRALLLRVADLYEQRADEIVKWQMAETSCVEIFARFNIKLAVDGIRDLAGSLIHAMTGAIPPMQAEGWGLVVKEPIGPVLTIPPWNASIILSTRGVSAAIAAGCTVVLKASEVCPRTHSLIVEIFEQAGLPKGCINQVQAARKDAAAVTETLISHHAIRKVEFIGSAGVGKQIGQTAAKYLKPILMELGGKGPALVLKDANLEAAAALCAFGAFVHHGQICFSTERIIVDKAVAEKFIELLKKEVNSNYGGAVGMAASLQGANRAHELIDKAIKRGAQFVVGDNTFVGDSRASLKPTIITGVQASDEVSDQETFGPSASLYIVDSEQEAIRLANASAYGLSASIHSIDHLRALNLARELDYGQVHINSTTVYDQSTLPIGGIKGSGWGNNNSHYGLSEFLIDKTITLHSPKESLTFGV